MYTYLADYSYSVDEKLKDADVLEVEGTTPVEVEIIGRDFKIPVGKLNNSDLEIILNLKVKCVLTGNIYYTRNDMIRTSETPIRMITKEAYRARVNRLFGFL